MTGDSKHEETPREGEGDDALWRLLDHAPRPRPVSPYFARRVLREVALAGARPDHGGFPGWLARLWPSGRRMAFAGALGAVALLAIGTGFFSHRGHSPEVVAATAPAVAPVTSDVGEPVPTTELTGNDPGPQPTVAFSSVASEPVVTAQDVEVIADLDNLLSREESRLWTEDDTARF